MTAPVALTMLRAVAPDVPLTVGSILGARVLSREGDRGTLLLRECRRGEQEEGGGTGCSHGEARLQVGGE